MFCHANPFCNREILGNILKEPGWREFKSLRRLSSLFRFPDELWLMTWKMIFTSQQLMERFRGWHSTKVALVLPIFLKLKYRAQHRENAA